ncbi:Thioredoxin family protein [hydrothermal vent metagenome]|uniref:Thioredoxin family protein n=1 Tax=hydrothermal vent metagenome TaxID=652676 RepID=A0A3B0WN97_9ZZZZ
MIKHKLIRNFSVCLSLIFSTLAVAQNAPLFELPGDNKTINLQKLKGKVVYLDFWASWCVPCRKSFPWMNDMHSRYDGKDFTIVAVNLDASKSDALKFLKNLPVNFDIAYDPDGRVASKYKLKVMPSSYLIDRDGTLVFAHKGYREDDSNEIEKKIQKLINSK